MYNKKNKSEKKEIDAKFNPIVSKYIGILSSLQKESNDTNEFFKKYQETFLHHLKSVTHSNEKITSFINDFKEKVEKNKNSEETVDLQLFGMELLFLHEIFIEHMNIISPVINMSHTIKDMYDDLIFLHTKTNKLANSWHDKISDLLKDKPIKNKP